MDTKKALSVCMPAAAACTAAAGVAACVCVTVKNAKEVACTVVETCGDIIPDMLQSILDA